MGHIHLHVGDLLRAEDFYHRALGFDVVVRSYPGALFLSAGGYHHHLGTNTWAVGAERARDGDARLLEWEIILPDEASVAATADSLVRSGYAVARRDGDVLAEDPWGVTIRVKKESH
jgi:catechol 2,3-dioxygenase